MFVVTIEDDAALGPVTVEMYDHHRTGVALTRGVKPGTTALHLEPPGPAGRNLTRMSC